MGGLSRLPKADGALGPEWMSAAPRRACGPDPVLGGLHPQPLAWVTVAVVGEEAGDNTPHEVTASGREPPPPESGREQVRWVKSSP